MTCIVFVCLYIAMETPVTSKAMQCSVQPTICQPTFFVVVQTDMLPATVQTKPNVKHKLKSHRKKKLR